MPRRIDDQVINFTPESGFVIEQLAETIVKAMSELGMDAQVTLPGRVVLEIEKECTEQDIVEGYKAYLSTQSDGRQASNRNEKEPDKTGR